MNFSLKGIATILTYMYAKELTPKFADEKQYSVDAWIEETVSSTKKLKIENLAKNGMPKPLTYVYVEIVAVPLILLRAFSDE